MNLSEYYAPVINRNSDNCKMKTAKSELVESSERTRKIKTVETCQIIQWNLLLF